MFSFHISLTQFAHLHNLLTLASRLVKLKLKYKNAEKSVAIHYYYYIVIRLLIRICMYINLKYPRVASILSRDK